MSTFNDFWGAAKGRLKIRGGRRIRFWFKVNFWHQVLAVLKTIPAILRNFFSRIVCLPSVLNKLDKLMVLILLTILCGLIGYRYYREYVIHTKVVPAFGGTYEEILIGEANYLNPILAKSDIDRSINSLIYSGLIKIDQKGDIISDLAISWEIANDSKTYIFRLRNDAYWHDGVKFSSADVAYTIEEIKDQNIKSPYFQSWRDVTVETPDEQTVIFKLNSPYGPFIYNTAIGIIPRHVNISSLASLPIGTGPYKFFKAFSNKNAGINQVVLERNNNYWLDGYYIKYVKFHLVADEATAKKRFAAKEISAVANLSVDGKGIKRFSFSTSRCFGLVFNLASDKFKDETIRKKIKSGESFDPKIEFNLAVLDKPLYILQAESIKNDLSARGIEVKINKRSPIDFQTLMEKRQFEALLYGFDFGYDRDPYPYWHSSQINGGLNYSGFTDKRADILLEDARMTIDAAARNQRYDDFFQILNDKVPVIFYPQQSFTVSIKDRIRGVESISGKEPWDHLNNLRDWYIKTRRTKP